MGPRKMKMKRSTKMQSRLAAQDDSLEIKSKGFVFVRKIGVGRRPFNDLDACNLDGPSFLGSIAHDKLACPTAESNETIWSCNAKGKAAFQFTAIVQQVGKYSGR